MKRAFTLIETMVAIALLTISIVAPMALTIQSLASAFYARDQVVASNLAQEGIESVRSLRDSNILQIAQNANSGLTLFSGIPLNAWFTIDTRTNAVPPTTPACGATAASCPALQTDQTFYGYNVGWTNTAFTRSLFACYVQTNGTCNAITSDEMKVTVVVSWKSGSFQTRTITLYENLYRWVQDGSASQI